MKYLLDVNVLVAWGWSDHVDHDRTVTWIAAAKKQKAIRLLTSPIPQLGFVRVSVQRTGGRLSILQAGETLTDMLASLGACHLFLNDDRSAVTFPDWCRHPSRTTDAHLLRLAEAHQAKLATLDAGIPGAFLLPTRAT